MGKTVVRRGLCALLIFLALGVVVWLPLRGLRTTRATLPDGSTLMLEGWSYGKHHTLKVRGPKWWQQILPPTQEIVSDTDSNALTLWISQRNLPPHSKPTASHWWDWAEIVDEKGHRVVTTHPDVGGNAHDAPLLTSLVSRRTLPPDSYLLPSNNDIAIAQQGQYQALHIRVFPRRSENIKLRFYAAGRTRPVAEFSVPNPTPNVFPTWKAEALPDTKQDGDLAFTLTRFASSKSYNFLIGPNSWTGAEVPPKGLPLPPGETLYTDAFFRARQNGKPVDWRPMDIRFADAVGNITSLPEWPSDEGEPSISFLTAFCEGEPQKISVAFMRGPDAVFSPEELWTVSGIAKPGAGAITRSQAALTRDGVTLRCLGIAAPGKVHWGNKPWSMLQSSYGSVRVAISPSNSALRLLVRVTDDQGHEVLQLQHQPSHHWLTPRESQSEGTPQVVNQFADYTVGTTFNDDGIRYLTFFFRLPAGAKRLNLTFALNKPRIVEFLTNLPPAR